PVLLETRVGCIRDLSLLCLDAVDQAGSAALAHDQQLVREVRDGVSLAVPITVDAAELRLEERLGDSALISLGDVADGEPASILLMKGEAGWRIRDFLEW
ncbi:MAG: serine/threonine protein kinase, partial [Rhodoglobus sp.]|nr:serine/threonine protein kinase [Rhodoglobus sp.]